MRERTRRIAQTELTVVAQDLFLEHGYEETTVDQIAAAAGMSKRTFFRYFPSKDALVIGKYDLFGDRMAEALDQRPADEPVWESLRRVFDITLDYVQDEHQRARNDAMEAIVRSTRSSPPATSRRCSGSSSCSSDVSRTGSVRTSPMTEIREHPPSSEQRSRACRPLVRAGSLPTSPCRSTRCWTGPWARSPSRSAVDRDPAGRSYPGSVIRTSIQRGVTVAPGVFASPGRTVVSRGLRLLEQGTTGHF